MEMTELNLASSSVDFQNINGNLGFMINSLARLLRIELEKQLVDSGLSPTTWTVLMALGERDGIRQIELSQRAFMDGATMTRALDILEAKYFIKRERAVVDRRAQIVTLTDAGKSAFEKYLAYGVQLNELATSKLSNEDKLELGYSIQNIIRTLQNESKNGEDR